MNSKSIHGWKGILKVLRAAGKGWIEDGASRLAAAISFYTALSLAPLLTILIFILGVFLGEEAAQGFLVDEIENVTDRRSALFIQSLIGRAGVSDSGIIASVFGVCILLWGATRLFYELQEALDLIFESVGEKNQPALKVVAKRRLLALGMCFVLAFLLLVSLAINSALSYAVNSIRVDLPGKDWLWLVMATLVSFATIWMVFAALYKWLPRSHVSWKGVLWGSAVSSALFAVGKDLFGWYLSRQDSVEGAAGALIAVLLWVYFSAQVLFLGAEIAKAVAQRANARG